MLISVYRDRAIKSQAAVLLRVAGSYNGNSNSNPRSIDKDRVSSEMIGTVFYYNGDEYVFAGIRKTTNAKNDLAAIKVESGREIFLCFADVGWRIVSEFQHLQKDECA